LRETVKERLAGTKINAVHDASPLDSLLCILLCTHKLILKNDRILKVQRREIHRDSEKYPTTCRFQITCSRGLHDDDQFKPVWPSGLWATSQGGETSKAYNHIQPFIEAFWQSTSLRSSDTC